MCELLLLLDACFRPAVATLKAARMMAEGRGRKLETMLPEQ